MLAKSRFRIGFYGVFGSCGFVDSIKEKAEETPTGAQNERPKRRKPQHREPHDQKAKNDPQNGPSWPQVGPKISPSWLKLGRSCEVVALGRPGADRSGPWALFGRLWLGPWVGRGRRKPEPSENPYAFIV